MAKNHKLGTFILEIEPMPAGLPKIDVKVSVDLDGILTVTAMDRQNQSGMEIRACKTTLNQSEVQYRKFKTDYEEVHEEVEKTKQNIEENLEDMGKF